PVGRILPTSSHPRHPTSFVTPHLPIPSGRPRHFHHVIPNPPDDVVIFTTSSQTFRTTSSFSPRHPSGFFLYIRLLIAMLLSKFQSSRSPHKKKRYFHMKVPRFIKNIIVIS